MKDIACPRDNGVVNKEEKQKNYDCLKWEVYKLLSMKWLKVTPIDAGVLHIISIELPKWLGKIGVKGQDWTLADNDSPLDWLYTPRSSRTMMKTYHLSPLVMDNLYFGSIFSKIFWSIYNNKDNRNSINKDQHI